jgi:hypothetical protein
MKTFLLIELKESAGCKGHFTMYNSLVLGHTKHNRMQRVKCKPFPVKPLYGSHLLDLVVIRPPGIDYGGLVLSQDYVWIQLWNARTLLLFSTSAHTNTGSK